MATKSISQLDSATSVSASDLYEVAIPDAQSASGYASKKESGAQIATFFHDGIQNNNLNTTDKTLVGAINEVNGLINVGALFGTSTALSSGINWYKVASVTIQASDNSARTICLLVIDTAYNSNACILNCQVRITSAGIEMADLEMVANCGFSTSEFRLYATIGESSYTFEIWTTITRRYKYRRFIVLNQGDRVYLYSKEWTLRSSTAPSAAPTESASCVRFNCVSPEYVNQSEVATVEDGDTASQAYTIGDYMFWKGGFYKVTASISSGGAITVGTNITKTTIGAELKAALS